VKAQLRLGAGLLVKKGKTKKDERIGSAAAIPFVSSDQFGLSHSCLRRRKVQ
jgi:ABC-type taurine transport system substrate-binding protein